MPSFHPFASLFTLPSVDNGIIIVLVEQREMITMATRSATIFAYRVPLARIIKLSALSGAAGALALEHLPAILALFIH